MSEKKNRPLKVVYRKDGNKWRWSILYANGEVAAEGPTAYTFRWVARRSVLLMIDCCKRLAVIEETDPEARDYPLNKKPKREKPVAGGESDLIDRFE